MGAMVHAVSAGVRAWCDELHFGSFALCEGNNLIDFRDRKFLFCSTGPMDLDGVDFGGVAQSEVDAGVVS